MTEKNILIKFLLIFISTYLLSCGISRSEFEMLQKENQALKKTINELKSQKAERRYIANHSQVSLANTELHNLASNINGQQYQIKIKLPRGYESGSKKYPVLYVTDAETNFGGISYIVQRLIKDKLIPPILVVGVAYGTDYKSFYALRSRDLTPVEDKSLRFGDPTGGADQFIDFLSKELFPFIEKEYRVKADDRALYGHSYGGLFGSYVLLNKAELFDKYLLLSPSFWYYNQMMLDQAKHQDLNFSPTKLYMASGELEGRLDDMQEEFIKILKSRKPDHLSIKNEVMDNETHRTIFGPGFTNGMRYLYAD